MHGIPIWALVWYNLFRPVGTQKMLFLFKGDGCGGVYFDRRVIGML